MRGEIYDYKGRLERCRLLCNGLYAYALTCSAQTSCCHPSGFAVLFGPLVGGLGAALGTFTASVLTYGTVVLTIFNGTPANFVCFYVLSRLSKPFNWRNFIAATLLGFLAGSIIIGFGLWPLLANLSFLIPAGTCAFEAVKG